LGPGGNDAWDPRSAIELCGFALILLSLSFEICIAPLAGSSHYFGLDDRTQGRQIAGGHGSDLRALVSALAGHSIRPGQGGF
jgi:hypothetical protein